MAKRRTKRTGSSSLLTRKSSKILKCKNVACKNRVTVDIKCEAVICWECVARSVPGPIIKKQYEKSTKPAGWAFMNEFVDADGTVYHKGIEQKKLKGKVAITDVEKIRKEQQKKRKITKKRKEVAGIRKQERLVKEYDKKKKALKKIEVKKAADAKKLEESMITEKPVKKTRKKTVKKPVKRKTSVKKPVKKTVKKTVKKASKKRVYSKTPKITQSIINKMVKMYKKENFRITNTMIDKLGYDKYRIKATLRTAGVYGRQN